MLCSLLKVVTLSFTFSHLIPCDRRDDGAYSILCQEASIYLEIASGNGSVSATVLFEKNSQRAKNGNIFSLNTCPTELFKD